MAGLEMMSAATPSETYKTVRETFLGRERPAEQKDTESEEVTAVEAPENTPSKDKQELGQCHRYSKKG